MQNVVLSHSTAPLDQITRQHIEQVTREVDRLHTALWGRLNALRVERERLEREGGPVTPVSERIAETSGLINALRRATSN